MALSSNPEVYAALAASGWKLNQPAEKRTHRARLVGAAGHPRFRRTGGWQVLEQT
jgi:hypothetical protein